MWDHNGLTGINIVIDFFHIYVDIEYKLYADGEVKHAFIFLYLLPCTVWLCSFSNAVSVFVLFVVFFLHIVICRLICALAMKV